MHACIQMLAVGALRNISLREETKLAMAKLDIHETLIALAWLAQVCVLAYIFVWMCVCVCVYVCMYELYLQDETKLAMAKLGIHETLIALAWLAQVYVLVYIFVWMCVCVCMYVRVISTRWNNVSYGQAGYIWDTHCIGMASSGMCACIHICVNVCMYVCTSYTYKMKQS
jgi:hypothetical protein